MPLYIRDEQVNDLAQHALQLTGGESKTAIVRRALEAFIASHREKETMTQKVSKIQSRAESHGIVADGYNDKLLMDAAWDDI